MSIRPRSTPHRDLRDQGRPAQRRPRRRQGLGRSGLSRAAVQGRDRRRSPSSAMPAARASISSRWRTRRSATTWSSARCAPVTRGRCSACRRSGTSRRLTARARSTIRAACSKTSASTLPTGHRNPRVGFDRRDALPGDPDAARRHRRLERGETRRAGHARFHDRHRLPNQPKQP